MLGKVLGSGLELHHRVGIAQCTDGDGPVAGAIGALRQLATGGIAQTQLDAHGLVHPVVGCKLGAVGGLGVGVGAVIAVVGPHHRLHPGAQLAVVAVQIHTDELAKAAYIAAAAQVHGKTIRSLLGGFCHAGTGAGMCGREGVAIAALGSVLQAVGVFVHRSR